MALKTWIASGAALSAGVGGGAEADGCAGGATLAPWLPSSLEVSARTAGIDATGATSDAASGADGEGRAAIEAASVMGATRLIEVNEVRTATVATAHTPRIAVTPNTAAPTTGAREPSGREDRGRGERRVGACESELMWHLDARGRFTPKSRPIERRARSGRARSAKPLGSRATTGRVRVTLPSPSGFGLTGSGGLREERDMVQEETASGINLLVVSDFI